MAEELKVEIRSSLGKHSSRRLRKAGGVPGVLYGHGKENVCLSAPADTLDALVTHGGRLVTLIGGVNESAFIRDVQWDIWGTHVLHVDFTRVSEDEKVEVEIPIELRGEAPGLKEGGVVEQIIHQLQIDCPAGNVPERISASINNLKLHDSITVADLELPDGATVLGETSAVVVHCVEPIEVPEEAVVEAAPGEPEVIGMKDEE